MSLSTKVQQFFLDHNRGHNAGQAISCMRSMNANKTQLLLHLSTSFAHAGFSYAAFQPLANSRDVVEGEHKLIVNGNPSNSLLSMGAPNAFEIIKWLEANKDTYDQHLVTQIRDGSLHTPKGLKLVLVDEGNNFSRDLVGQKMCKDLIEYSQEQGLFIVFAGLDKNYRGENFGRWHLLKGFCYDISDEQGASCKAQGNNGPCGNRANFTIRAISQDLAREKYGSQVADQLSSVQYFLKDNSPALEGKWVLEPYFGPELAWEQANDPKLSEREKNGQINVDYFPVCKGCFEENKPPFRSKTNDVLRALSLEPVQVGDLLQESYLVEPVQNFLLDSDRPRALEVEGGLVAIPYFDDGMGSFSPASQIEQLNAYKNGFRKDIEHLL